MFICVFIFYHPSQLFNLLLSICNIHSNIFLSKGQLAEISKMFNGKIVSSQFVNILNNCSKNDNTEYIYIYILLYRYPPNTYSVKSLCNTINSCDAYNNFFNQLRNQLIEFILNPNMYNNMVKRRTFYYENGINAIPPPEPCFSKLIRNTFTKKPSPYHYDFSCIPNPKGMEEMLFSVRQRFGYSSRRSSYNVNTSVPKTRSSKSLKSPELTNFNVNNSHHEIKHKTAFSSKVTSNKSSTYKSCPDIKQQLLIDVETPKDENSQS